MHSSKQQATTQGVVLEAQLRPLNELDVVQQCPGTKIVITIANTPSVSASIRALLTPSPTSGDNVYPVVNLFYNITVLLSVSLNSLMINAKEEWNFYSYIYREFYSNNSKASDNLIKKEDY